MVVFLGTEAALLGEVKEASCTERLGAYAYGSVQGIGSGYSRIVGENGSPDTAGTAGIRCRDQGGRCCGKTLNS